MCHLATSHTCINHRRYCSFNRHTANSLLCQNNKLS